MIEGKAPPPPLPSIYFHTTVHVMCYLISSDPQTRAGIFSVSYIITYLRVGKEPPGYQATSAPMTISKLCVNELVFRAVTTIFILGGQGRNHDFHFGGGLRSHYRRRPHHG